jgi:hypothetical protein
VLELGNKRSLFVRRRINKQSSKQNNKQTNKQTWRTRLLWNEWDNTGIELCEVGATGKERRKHEKSWAARVDVNHCGW